MKQRPTDQNSCPKSSFIDAYLDGALDHEAKARMTEHLRRCESCRLERADMVALGKLCRRLPQRDVSSLVVQRAKTTLSTRNRRPQRPSLRDRLADIYADRPLALHGTAVALGLLVSFLTYGLGRLHQSQAQLVAGERVLEVAESAAGHDALLKSDLDSKLAGTGSVLPSGSRRRRGDLIIESMTIPEEADDDPVEIVENDDGAEALVSGPEWLRPRKRVEVRSQEPEPLPTMSTELLQTPSPEVPEGREAVAFSDQALRVLEDMGSLDEVSQEISEAAPNWARLLTDALQQAGVLSSGKLKGTKGLVEITRLTRDMIIIMDTGDSKLRMHITMDFGTGIEPRVQVKRAEAKSSKKLAPKRP